MKSPLPVTGTARLLAALSPHIPDDFINACLPPMRGRGRRRLFSAAQMWRTHLLTLLTPVHTFNLLVKMIGEQQAWRRFAHLPHRECIPDVLMLHQFRDRVGVRGLRRINEQLLQPLIPFPSAEIQSVGLIDATDLPASTSGFKKNERVAIRLNTPRWEHGL